MYCLKIVTFFLVLIVSIYCYTQEEIKNIIAERQKECEKIPNSYYNSCGSACELNCNEIDQYEVTLLENGTKSYSRNVGCVGCAFLPPGCKCLDGYFRDTATNKCVRPEECSKL